MKQLTVATKQKRQVVDITDRLTDYLSAGNGVLSVFIQHTTAALTTADLDPGTDLDFLDFLEAIVPDRKWRHPHNPAHAPDHLLASVIGPQVSVPYADGKLLLGTWQRVILVELDGPRERTVTITLLKS
jgi:secondary thiamine-phosphate synthase enzyme